MKNSRAALISVFITVILREHSDRNHPLSRQAIAAYLASEYDVHPAKSTLSRHLKNIGLVDWDYHYETGKGGWYESNSVAFYKIA